MPAILKQRKFLVTKIFEITDKSLKVSVKKPTGYFENEFDFEELGNKITHQKQRNNIFLIAGMLPLAASIVFFVLYANDNRNESMNEFIICFCTSSFLFFLSLVFSAGEVLLYLHDKRFISLYANLPSSNEVTAFIYLIKSEQKKYLLDRYAKNDPYWSVEQKSNNLDWLRERDIINNEELKELRLQNLPKPGVTAIGFRN